MINTSCPLHKAEVRQLMMVCRINFRDRKLFSFPSSLFHSFFAPFSLLAPSIPPQLPRDCFNFEMELSAPRGAADVCWGVAICFLPFPVSCFLSFPSLCFLQDFERYSCKLQANIWQPALFSLFSLSLLSRPSSLSDELFARSTGCASFDEAAAATS